MSQTELVLETWTHLPQEVRDLAAPIGTDAQYQDALRLFEAVWDQVGEQLDHPLGSLFELLRDRIAAYEEQVSPVEAASPERVLAFLMEEQGTRQVQLAEVLGITQGSVSRLLRGQTQFTVETVRLLARHFRVSPAVFLVN